MEPGAVGKRPAPNTNTKSNITDTPLTLNPGPRNCQGEICALNSDRVDRNGVASSAA